MLCPEVWNFQPPKVITTHKEKQDLISVKNYVNMNYFYRSLIVTCPDEINTPGFIQDLVTEDSDYYKLTGCPLTELVKPIFIESFVKNGQIFCLSANTNCMTQNCATITPEGYLIIHIPYYVYQTLGLEGVKRPHNYYEIKIDLRNIKNYERVTSSLQKLELFDFYITWEPLNKDICPSTVAKYFDDVGVEVSVHSLNTKNITPSVDEIPAVQDTDADEMVEWLGLIAHDVDLTPTDMYISSYMPPDSENAMKTSRISVFIVNGFISSTLISEVCTKLSEYVLSRETPNYWASISVQTDENSPIQWNLSSKRMFQAHNSSCNVFFTHNGNMLYSVGQLIYS